MNSCCCRWNSCSWASINTRAWRRRPNAPLPIVRCSTMAHRFLLIRNSTNQRRIYFCFFVAADWRIDLQRSNHFQQRWILRTAILYTNNNLPAATYTSPMYNSNPFLRVRTSLTFFRASHARPNCCSDRIICAHLAFLLPSPPRCMHWIPAAAILCLLLSRTISMYTWKARNIDCTLITDNSL